ncbi:iron ABC transporter permease [Treponema sp. OMZ 840]|uniref:ABC transporter permease n=1 Tax=Treponema sp. OMZ 840 TaxID=244313 RepID=UPI003D8B8C65
MENVKKDMTESFSLSKKIKNTIINTLTNPYNILVFFSVVILVLLVVIPLTEMIITTLQVAAKDVSRIKGVSAGDWTFYYWKRVLASTISQNMLYKPLLHSLCIAIAVSFFSIAIGGSIAWLLIRSDIPCKRFFSLVVIIPYMIPSWCKSMAWIAVFKTSRIGGSLGFLSFLGIVPPDWLAYGPIAIICVLTVHYYAYAYLLVSAALRSINSELEEQGEMLGASKLLILRKITFPLVMPALLSSFILIFSKAMGTFGVPAYLGLKVGYYTISTMLYTAIKQQQTATAYVISLILIDIAAIVIYINQLIIGKRKSYATIGGKGGKSNLIPLNHSKIPIMIFFFIFLAAGVLLPVGILVLQSLTLKLGDYSLHNLTLHYWFGKGNPQIYYGTPGILKNPAFYAVLWNSLKLVIVASLAATCLGQLIGYIISRGRKLKSGRLVEQLAFIPYLIPSIAFGAMYLSMFSVERAVFIFGHKIVLFPVLYGTFGLLVLVTTIKNLPFSSRAGAANMIQLSIELEEAGKIAGAGFGMRLRKIVFPLSKSGFISGFLLVFMAIMKELDLIVLLVSPKTQTLPYLTYYYMSGGMEQHANASAVLMFLIVYAVYWIANKFFKADISAGF